jgi:PAS domain S-box-containing protein
MLKILRLTLLVLLFFQPLAQADKPDTTAQQYDVKSLTLKNGLIQSSVRGIVQDRSGLIWLGTEAGVQVFDGLHLKRLGHMITSPADFDMPTVWVNQLLESQNGNILIATRRNGLFKFDPKKRSILQFTPEGFAQQVQVKFPFYQVCEDNAQKLWAVTDNGLLQLDPSNGSWQVIIASTSDNRFTDIACLKDSIITRRAGELVKWHKASGEVETLSINSNADSYDSLLIKQIAPHYTLVGKQDGLFRLTNDFSKLVRVWPIQSQDPDMAADISMAAVNDIIYHDDDSIWLGTQFRGLLLVELSSGKVLKQLTSVPDNEFTLSGNNILRLMKDHSGLLWASVYGFGIDRMHMNQTAMKSYITYTEDPLIDNDITAITEGPGDSLWFAVHRTGVRRLSLSDMSNTDYTPLVLKTYQKYAPDELPYISDIELDRLNRLWFTSNKGIFRVSITTGHSQFYPRKKNNLSGPRVRGRDIFSDKQGVMYVTDEGAILRYNALTDTFSRLPIAPIYEVDSALDVKARIKAIVQHPDDSIYVLGGQNIYRLNENEQLEPLLGATALNEVFGGLVNSFTIDSEGHFYIAGRGGLIKITTDQSTKPKLELFPGKNLPDNYFYAIEIDNSGNLWLSTNNGVVHFNKQSKQYNQFGLSDGVLVREFNGRASFKRNNGHLIFGGIDGWTVVSPEKIILNKSTPRLSLSSYQIGTKTPQTTVPEQGINMLFTDHWLQFSFSALDFRSPHENKYSYFLEGFDPQWRSFGSQSEISYTGLPPGKYTLHARAATKRGAWHPEPLSIELSVAPPFFRSTTAYITYALLLMISIGGFIWYSRRLNAERANSLEMIETSQQRMKLALWGSGDSIWDWHITDNEIYRSSLHFLGFDEENMANTIESFKALIYPQDLDVFEHELGEVLACHTAEYCAQYRVKHKNGSWLWVADQGKVIETTASKKPIRISGTIRDISITKRYEQELEQLNAELEQKIETRTQQFADQNEQLRDTLGNLKNTQNQLVESEKMASLGNLVAGISHEINTPVGVALTAASNNTHTIEQLQNLFLERKLTVKDMKKGIAHLKASNELIESSINRTAQLIQTFKQVAVDHNHHEWRIIELPIYLIEIVPTFNSQVAHTNYTVEVVDGPFFDVECAPGDLYQIISQLVNNSINHGFSGRNQGKIIIETEHCGDHWQLRYSDNGNGLNNDTRDHIFEPFYTTRRGDGYAGLGMHLVFNIVCHSLGGTIECTSEEGNGILLTIVLPLRKLNSPVDNDAAALKAFVI